MKSARKRGARCPAVRVLAGVAGMLVVFSLASACAGEVRRITFREAVEIALEQNNELKRAANQTALDRSAVTEARMAFVPNLQFRASGNRGLDRSLDPTDKSMDAGLSSSLVLFDGLANVASLQAANLQEKAGVLDEARTRQTVVFTVISGYLAMIEAGEQVRVREENLTAQTDEEQQVKTLVEGGRRPVSDLYQQQASVAAARLALVEARRTLELSRVDIVQALQLDALGEYEFEIPPLPESVGEGPELDLPALLERAFRQRPDLTAVGARWEAAGEDESAASGGRWPSVSLSGSYGGGYSSLGTGGVLDQMDENRSGSVGLSLSLPLFDRLATRQGIRRARVNTDNARIALADLRQEVALQVRRAALDWNAARERLHAAEAQTDAARQALEAMQDRYDAGAATLTEVTLARADLVTATSAGVSARYSLLWQGRLLDYYVGDLDPSSPLVP